MDRIMKLLFLLIAEILVILVFYYVSIATDLFRCSAASFVLGYFISYFNSVYVNKVFDKGN